MMRPSYFFVLTAFAVLFSIFCPKQLFAQGTWNPAGADLSYPRTLLDSTEIDSARAHLGDSLYLGLYAQISSQAFIWPINGNTNVGERRLRSSVSKNAAFVVLMNRKYNNSTGQIDTLSSADRDTLISHIIYFMENANHDMATWPAYDDWQYRSNELANFAVAYDLLRGAGVPAAQLANGASQIQDFAGHFYDEIDFLIPGLGFLDIVKNNHATRVVCAMGLAAVVLNDQGSSDVAKQPQSWINMAMWNTDNILFRDNERQSDPGGLFGYGEGPTYLKYGMNHHLELMHAFGNFLPDGNYSFSYDGSSRSIRNPWYDPSYDLIWDWYMRIRMPDGRLPSLNDSYISDGYPTLSILEKPEFHSSLHFDKIPVGQSRSLSSWLRTGSDDMRADYICSRTGFVPEARNLFQPLPEAGNLVFRSSWGPEGTYLHLLGEHGIALESGNGHNQADVTSFILYHNGHLLALDPGYLKWDRRDEVGEFDNHNMLEVDGEGPGTGTIGDAQGADGFIENFFELPDLHYGEIRTNYKATDIVRKVLSPRDEYFILTDFVRSSGPHDYTFQLHGHGRMGGDSIAGDYHPNYASFSGQWDRGDAKLTAQVIARDSADEYRHDLDVHEFRYDLDSSHHTLRVTKSQVAATEFVSTLIPHGADTFDLKPLIDADWSGFVLNWNGHEDFYAAGPLGDTIQLSASQTGLAADLAFQGEQVFLGMDGSGAWEMWFVENASYLKYDGEVLLKSDSGTVTLGLKKLSSVHYLGFNEDLDGEVTFGLAASGGTPLYAGTGCVRSTAWNANTDQLTFALCPDSYFEIADTALVLPAQNGPSAEEPLKIWPNPAKNEIWVNAPQVVEQMELLTFQGKVLRREVGVQSMQRMDLRGITPGLYLFQVTLKNGERKIRRILVE